MFSKNGSECQIDEVYFCEDGYWAYPTYPDISRIMAGDKCSTNGSGTVISLCGNGVISTGEGCDYVGTGCTNCQPSTGYECFTNNTCKLQCGNGVLNTG